MNILLIGSGGREHALAWAMKQSSSIVRGFYATPGNPGILEHARQANIDHTNHDEVVSFCRRLHIDLVVIGPEQPLADGLTDALRAANIFVFGPGRKAAQLESSKSFAKEIMSKYHIPTARGRKFSSHEFGEACEYIATFSHPPVIKFDGLAAGKGVAVPETHKQAQQVLANMFADSSFGAEAVVVVEEFMEGEEASVFAICDGSDFVTLAPAQDHKRIDDGDVGKNTGGMGAYCPTPIVDDGVMEKVKNTIIRPLLAGMKQENMPFVGCLFVGLMIANGEPRVVEFNVRFGDPETQAVLSVFRGDLVRLFASAARGEIDRSAVRRTNEGFACNVVLASQGYPDNYEKGMEISGIADAELQPGIKVFHSGTRYGEFGALNTDGGRVLGVCASADSLQEAVANAYRSVDSIYFNGKTFRRDIGKKGLDYYTQKKEGL